MTVPAEAGLPDNWFNERKPEPESPAQSSAAPTKGKKKKAAKAQESVAQEIAPPEAPASVPEIQESSLADTVTESATAKTVPTVAGRPHSANRRGRQ